MGRGLVVGGLVVVIGNDCVGVASGGNTIFWEGDISRGLNGGETGGGVSVVSLKLLSNRDDSTTSAAIVGDNGLIGGSRGLVGVVSTCNGVSEMAGASVFPLKSMS